MQREGSLHEVAHHVGDDRGSAERRNACPLQPLVLKFRVPLQHLAPLESLHFVRGDYDDERFWSLVQYCRQSPPGAARISSAPDEG